MRYSVHGRHVVLVADGRLRAGDKITGRGFTLRTLFTASTETASYAGYSPGGRQFRCAGGLGKHADPARLETRLDQR